MDSDSPLAPANTDASMDSDSFQVQDAPPTHDRPIYPRYIGGYIKSASHTPYSSCSPSPPHSPRSPPSLSNNHSKRSTSSPTPPAKRRRTTVSPSLDASTTVATHRENDLAYSTDGSLPIIPSRQSPIQVNSDLSDSGSDSDSSDSGTSSTESGKSSIDSDTSGDSDKSSTDSGTSSSDPDTSSSDSDMSSSDSDTSSSDSDTSSSDSGTSSSDSDTSSEPSQVLQASESVSSSLPSPSSLPSSLLTPYFSMPAGTLPPPSVCRQAGKPHLARIPIRETTRLGLGRYSSPVHGHFFSKATTREISKNRGLAGKILCRVKFKGGTQCCFAIQNYIAANMPRAYHHIKSRHGPMLEELNEFWKNQIEQSSSSLLAAAATAAEETAAAAAAARQSGPITITVDDSQDITTDSEPDQDCELLAVVTKPRANRHRRSLPGPNSTTHPENPITIEDPEDMDVDTPDQDHSLRVVAEEQESQMDGSILQVPMTMDTKPEQVGNDQLTRMIATSIAIDSLPMSILDTTLVKSLVALSNPRAVVPSLAAVESALSLSYVKMSAAAKLAILEANISLGSFTADIWKSQQGKMFLGLTFHYLTSDFEPQTVPIGIKLLEDFLDPESIKLIIDDVLHDWSLIDKVFCGTTDEGILKGVTDPVFQQRDRRITGIACTCHKIQLCINNALEECKDAGTALERFHNFHQLLGRGFKHLVQPPSSSASSASPSQGGGDQKQQRQQQQEQKDPQTQQQNEHEHEHEQAKNERLGFNFLWNPPTTYCKSWANGGEGRLYWCNLYLLVRGHTYNVLTATEKMTSGAVVDLQAKEKLKQAAVKTEDMETMRNVLLVLQPVFDLWTWVSGYSGGNPGGGGDNHHHHHHHSQESTTSSDHGSSSSGTGTGSAGKKDQVYYISKVYPVIHNLIQAEMPVTHPIAEALRLALLKRLKGEWSLDHIPDPVLMATFLDPCTAGHAIFDSTVERNHIKNDLLSYTKSLIVKAVQQTVDRRSDPPVYAFDHEANVTDSGNTNSSSPSVVSMNVEAEFVVFFSTLLQDRPENLWDDPRSWWQRHTSAMPLLSSVARNCFSIQATSLPPAQLFDGAQGAESILADPRGHTNEYKFIRLLTVRNLHKFLHGDSASQLDVANVLQ